MLSQCARRMNQAYFLGFLRVRLVGVPRIGSLKSERLLWRIGIELEMQILASSGTMTSVEVAAVAIGRVCLGVEYGFEVKLLACVRIGTV